MAGKFRHTLVLFAYRVPELASRRTKYRVSKIFLRHKFRSSTVTEKQ